MRANGTKTELPRQIVAYYLLFCLISIFWLGISVAVLSRASDRSRSESDSLSMLRQATSDAEIALARGEDSLQSFIERLKSQHSLAYCAIVSQDGRHLAQSSGFLNNKAPDPRRGTIDNVRFTDPDGRQYREYRAPLKNGREVAGTLLVAVVEPDGLATLTSMAQHSPIILLGPIFLLGVGGFVLHRMIRPLAKIESQLRQAAALPSLADSSLQTVQSRSAAALGWNRIAGEFAKPPEKGDLNERLSEAVRDRRNQQTDNILDSFPEGVATTDSEGRITFANRAIKALLAADEQDGNFVGVAMHECLGIDDGADISNDSPARPLVDPTNLQRTTIAELPKSAGHGQRMLRVARHPVGSGQRARHIWSVRDVTQHKLAEKMRDDFLDSATHELRTPLANIKAYSEALALSDVMEVEQQKDFCNTINGEATRLARLIDDLLSISSLEVGSLTIAKQRVELDRLLAEVTSKVAPLMKEKNLEFQTTLPDKMPPVKMDKDKIAVAIVNLLGNAAKYTPDGGRVALRVKAKDNQLVINVEDSGVGISSEELPRVFDKFFRSADVRVQSESGTGLGLSLAHEIVRLHGGELTVESQLEKGTTFTMTLPLT